jgi:hypothetical protein
VRFLWKMCEGSGITPPRRGAYFDARGFLIYRGRVLTKADSEYLAESETAFERPLTDEEIEAAFDDLVFYARAYEEDEEDE